MNVAGRIFWRGKTPWIAYYVAEHGEVRESVAKLTGKPRGQLTERDAQRALEARQKERLAEKWIGPKLERATVDELLDDYLRYLRPKGAKSISQTEVHARHISRAIGGERASRVTTERLERWIEDERKAGYAIGTINTLVGFLCAAFRRAQRTASS